MNNNSHGSWEDQLANKQPIFAAGRGRLRDKLLGIIVRVKINDEVVKTHASTDRLFAIEQALDAK